jgi:hypothetical protein
LVDGVEVEEAPLVDHQPFDQVAPLVVHLESVRHNLLPARLPLGERLEHLCQVFRTDLTQGTVY